MEINNFSKVCSSVGGCRFMCLDRSFNADIIFPDLGVLL